VDAPALTDHAPGVVGADALQRLKRDPRTARVPVLAIVGSDDAARHARALEAGADDVLGVTNDGALLGARVRALVRLGAATEALDESARRMRELEKVRDDLMKMIVHDLKTPLTSVLATLEMLSDGDFGGMNVGQERAVHDMRDRGNELLVLIDDLLQVWRIESTELKLFLEDIAPATLLEELIREWEYRFRQGQADVRVDVSPRIRGFRGDRALLRRVFGNLFQNALTHSPAPLELRLSARPDRRGILFTVADSGSGIPREYHEVIFRTFHRLPKPNETRIRGSGLGLAFCRLAVEAHGGRIWVQSQEGEGASFHVLLPLDPDQARDTAARVP
jgi:signal transduction histidine kinase